MAGTIFNSMYANGYVLTSTAQNPATISTTGKIQAGSIAGGLTAQSIATAWTVDDFGTIVGAGGNYGVYLQGGGTLSNASLALISNSGSSAADTGGIKISGGLGTVLNAGTVSGPGRAIYLTAGGNVTNAAGATISVGLSAIDINGAATVSNAGTLIGTSSYGVTLRAGGSIVNTGSGFISGGFDGIRAVDGYVSVHNTGSITGVQNYAVRLNGGYLYNGFSGRLTGGSDGVEFDNGGGKLVNDGMINGAGTYNTGLGSGVYMRGTGTIINAGTGTISGRLDGVFMQLTRENVMNSAVIVGTARYGVRLSNGGSVFNSGDASGGSVGIDISGGFYGTFAGTVSISAGARVLGTGTTSYGIRVGGGGTVYNAGIVTAGSIGLNVGTTVPTTITNVAEITGTSGYGIRIGGGATVVNSGYVFGGKIGVGILGGTEASTFTNTGTLSGAIGFSVSATTNTTLIDAGAITGTGGTAVMFGAGNDLLSLAPGASFGGGTVDGGSSTNTLELGAGTDTLAGLGTTVLNFGSIMFDTGADWDLVGNQAGFDGVISGFATGDTIDLQGLHETISNYNSGTLTLAGDAPIALQISGAFTTNSFQANSDHNGGTAITIACFAAGTRIAIPSGEQPIETLRPGDLVRSAFGGSVAVQWIGRRRLDCRRHPDPARIWPVRVSADAFAPGQPARDLWLSPDHSVLVEEVLVPIRTLINGRTIVQERRAEVTYYHLECPTHDAVLAEGLPSESYLDTGNRADFEGGGPALVLHPDFARDAWLTGACAPQITHGPVHARVRARLNARSETASPTPARRWKSKS